MTKMLETAKKIDELQMLIGNLQKDVLFAAQRFRNHCFKALEERTASYSNSFQLNVRNYATSVYDGPFGDFYSRAVEVNHVSDKNIIAINFVNDDDDCEILYFTPESLEEATMDQEVVKTIDTILAEFIEKYRPVFKNQLNVLLEHIDSPPEPFTLGKRDASDDFKKTVEAGYRKQLEKIKSILVELDVMEASLNK